MLFDREGVVASGTRGRAAAVEAVPVPKAQMMGRQDWRYVSGHANLVNYGTHPADTDVTSLAFSQDNLTLLSRAADDTLKASQIALRTAMHLPSTHLCSSQADEAEMCQKIPCKFVSHRTCTNFGMGCCNQLRDSQEDDSTFFDGWWGVAI